MKFLIVSALLSAALLVASSPVDSDLERANAAKWESFKVRFIYLLSFLDEFFRILIVLYPKYFDSGCQWERVRTRRGGGAQGQISRSWRFDPGQQPGPQCQLRDGSQQTVRFGKLIRLSYFMYSSLIARITVIGLTHYFKDSLIQVFLFVWFPDRWREAGSFGSSSSSN